MLFIIIGQDKPGAAALRAETRERHLAYLRDAGDRLKVAGPLRDPSNLDAPAGTLVIIEAASIEAARLMAENDPYVQAGVFQTWEVKPFKASLGSWL